MKKTVLVTGGAGFIGSHLVRALLERGDQVRVLDNFSTGRRENLADVRVDVEVIEGDVRDGAMVERALRGVEAVLHEAALPSVSLSFEQPALVDAVNVGGTATVMAAARKLGVQRVVLASSCAVYGDDAALPVGEASLPGPLSPYAVGKLAAEGYLRTLGGAGGAEAPVAVALRYFNVFGPRQDPGSEYSGVIARFMSAACEGSPCTVYGDGLQTRDFVYVGDVVAANLLALEADAAAGRVTNVGSGVETCLLDLIAGIEAAAGVRLNVAYGPAREGDIRRSCARITLAKELLGYEPRVALRDGLATTFEWYCAAAGAGGGPSRG